jgi:nucleotide-binding universal stress UspA family protein
MAALAAMAIPTGISLKNILLATDFSGASEKAFNYAVAVARRYGSKIFLMHVMPAESVSFIPEFQDQHRRGEVQRQLESMASRSELNQIPHETVMRAGSVWSMVSAVIRQQDIELVVLGTHGRSGLKKLVLGSVGEEVVRRAGCPVLTVGPHIDASLAGAAVFERILFATDFHSASTKAFDYALYLANEQQAKLMLLHVMAPAALPGPGQSFWNEPAITQWKNRVQANITGKLRNLLLPVRLWSEPECVVSFDFIADGILKTAAARKADLIVMGAKRSPLVKVSVHSFGAISYEVIRRANCPVLTVSA